MLANITPDMFDNIKNINVFHYSKYRDYTKQNHVRDSHLVLVLNCTQGEFTMNLKRLNPARYVMRVDRMCADNVNGTDMSITSRSKNLVINQDTVINYRSRNLSFIDFHFTVSNASEDCKLRFSISNQINQEVAIFFVMI